MSRQDANAAFARTSFLYGGNAAYIEDLHARYEADPGVGRCRVAGVLREPEGRPAPTSPRAASGPSWQRPNWPHAERRAGRGADGDWGEVEKAVGDKIKAQGAGQGRRALRRRRAAGDARFHPRADADPRLPHARPLPRQARSARRSSRRRTRRSSIRAPTASPKPTWTARSSSTRCSASNSRRCARSSRSCGAPTARRSASSSCTSPIRRRRPGSRSASRAATRRSPSPARASARSSTSWSRPKASRNSATSSSPAPSASASTAASR